MTSCISAVQHLRRLRGGSQSHLLRASDGASYVTKFQNNPQHLRVLANEMLGTRLGLALGLPMPRVEVIEVSDGLIASTPDLRIQLAGAEMPCHAGKQLASLYVGMDTSWPHIRLLASRTDPECSQSCRLRPGACSGQVDVQCRWAASGLLTQQREKRTVPRNVY